MKQILIFMASGILTFSAHAQFTKGNFLVGGKLGGGVKNSKQYVSGVTDPYNNTTEVNYDAQVSGGYFIVNNLAAGVTLDWAKDTQHSKQDDYTFLRSHDYSAGIFVRYYIEKFYFSSSYAVGKSSAYFYGDGVDRQLYRYHNFTGGIGYAFMLNQFVAIEPQLNYSLLNRTNREDADFTINTSSVMVGVALQFYLSKQ